MLGDRRKMSVALRRRGHARNGRRPGWDDDRGLRMTFGHSIVNSFAIIRAVCGQRRNIILDLIEQFRHFGNVADIIRRQFHSGNFMRASINAEVQLAPAAARPDAMFLIQPLALAIDLQASACMGFSVSRVFVAIYSLSISASFFVRLEDRFFIPACIVRGRGAERRSISAVGRRRRRREAILTAASAAQRLIRLGSPSCLLIFLLPRLAKSPCTTEPVYTNRGEPAIARETSRCNLVSGWPRAGAGP